MSKIADLVLNTRTGKWEAIYSGKVLASSPDKNYIAKTIEKGLNGKARAVGVVGVRELVVEVEGAEVAPVITFDVNERFGFLTDYVDMVTSRDRKSMIVVGEGGLGKTFTVMRQVDRRGLTNINDMEIGASLDLDNGSKTYVVVKGFSTAKGLFRTLYENRRRLVIFDDCDSILRDENASNILKAALDSYDRRIVTWNSESFGDDGLPKSFEFEGAVIFISNLSMRKIPQAIISRSAPVDVSMTRVEIVQRMRQIVAEGEFMADVAMSIKTDALNFIASQINNPQIKTLNLRTLMGVVTNRRCKPANWERLSLSEMMSAM